MAIAYYRNHFGLSSLLNIPGTKLLTHKNNLKIKVIFVEQQLQMKLKNKGNVKDFPLKIIVI